MEAVLPKGASATPAQDFAAREIQLYTASRQLLGGAKLFKNVVRSRSEVHAAILEGIPYASLVFLMTNLKALNVGDVVNVLGISARTLRRQKETPGKSMPADLASKTWLFAEMLAKATEVFGSKERAEEWMARPATGLDGQRPIDLLQTVQGAEIVIDFLTRLGYGVYTTNGRHALRMPLPLSLRKSAMVLKSGANRPVNHISSTLRWHSRSKRRLDCTRFR